MSLLDNFYQYYDAFELAYEDDNWEPIEAFFTDDAVYDVPGRGKVEGRDNVMATFQASLNAFDRNFPLKRKIEIIDGVEVRDDYVKIPGVIHYYTPDAPTLEVNMVEHLWYRDGLICRIVDNISEVEREKMMAHIAQYGDTLGFDK